MTRHDFRQTDCGQTELAGRFRLPLAFFAFLECFNSHRDLLRSCYFCHTIQEWMFDKWDEVRQRWNSLLRRPVVATMQQAWMTNQGLSCVYSPLSTRHSAHRLCAPNVASDLKGPMPLFGGGMWRTGEIVITGGGEEGGLHWLVVTPTLELRPGVFTDDHALQVCSGWSWLLLPQLCIHGAPGGWEGRWCFMTRSIPQWCISYAATTD